MRSGFRVDELRVDANATLVALDRAFEHIAHAKFLADRLGVGILPLEGEGRVAGDDEAVADAREVRRRKSRECRAILRTRKSRRFARTSWWS